MLSLMKSCKSFVKDFFFFFINLVLEGILLISQVINYTVYTIIMFIKNVIVPNIMHLLSDLSFIALIFSQGVLSALSSTLLLLSKLFLFWAEYLHYKSEQIINKTWDY